MEKKTETTGIIGFYREPGCVKPIVFLLRGDFEGLGTEVFLALFLGKRDANTEKKTSAPKPEASTPNSLSLSPSCWKPFLGRLPSSS